MKLYIFWFRLSVLFVHFSSSLFLLQSPVRHVSKPEIEEETRRIEDAGGRVIRWDGYRVGGLLALSRAIGSCH